MNRELYIHTIRQFRDECEKKHLDTEVEAFDAAIEKFEQPEIIRCKDCKHSHEDKLFTMLWCHGDIVDKNHFCSRAERRTDE